MIYYNQYWYHWAFKLCPSSVILKRTLLQEIDWIQWWHSMTTRSPHFMIFHVPVTQQAQLPEDCIPTHFFLFCSWGSKHISEGVKWLKGAKPGYLENALVISIGNWIWKMDHQLIKGKEATATTPKNDNKVRMNRPTVRNDTITKHR